MDASALASAESWLYWIGIAKLIAAFLVAAGVVIEFGSDWVARPFEKMIAHAREMELEGLRNDATRARASIAEANARADEARAQAASAQLELVRLQTPRTLRQDQQEIIIERLKNSPKGEVSVATAFVDSTDAGPFSTSVKETLTKAGFTIVDPPKPLRGIMSWDRPGAWLLTHDQQSAPPYAVAIQRAFAAVGIFLMGQAKPDEVPQGALVIAISSHPLKPDPVPQSLLDWLKQNPIADAAPGVAHAK